MHTIKDEPVNRGGRPKGMYVPGSLQDRIRKFFEANADEELTYSDMAAKFGCTPGGARNAVREMRDMGELESIHVIRPKRSATKEAAEA